MDHQDSEGSIDALDSIESINAAVKNIDQFLEQEDPEFTQSMNALRDAGLTLAAAEDSTVQIPIGIPATFTVAWTDYLKKPFAIKTNTLPVFSFWTIISLVLAGAYFGLQTKFWDKKASLFITSLGSLGSSVESYDPATDTESFFDSPRLARNVVAVKRMVVNIKPSADSGENPMLAFEINIEGISRDVAVEIKDREAEMVDLISRVTEGFSYDELSSAVGKKKLSEKLLTLLNANLTKGQARKIMYASFILKN